MESHMKSAKVTRAEGGRSERIDHRKAGTAVIVPDEMIFIKEHVLFSLNATAPSFLGTPAMARHPWRLIAAQAP
jgi:hypothetical protein